MPRAGTVGTHRRLHVSVLREDLSDAETHGPASCRSSYYGGQGEVERTQQASALGRSPLAYQDVVPYYYRLGVVGARRWLNGGTVTVLISIMFI